MAIEDKYEVFYELYDKIDDDENYIISIDSYQFGFVEKLGDDIFVEIQGCYKPILNYSNNKIEIFQFSVSETFITFSKPEFDRIKKQNTTHLIFKN